MKNKINVLIVDDHAVVRTGYKTFLDLSDRIGTVIETDRGENACQIYEKYHSDVVILDLSMPGIGGFESIRRLLDRDPGCKILVFTMHDEMTYLSRALKAGVKGYIIKSNQPDILVTAVCTIAKGGTFVTPELAQKMTASMSTQASDKDLVKHLSPREFDIFCLLANGMTPREIATKLCISYKTVCNHSTTIKEKLETKSIAQMTLLASRQGLIQFVHQTGEESIY